MIIFITCLIAALGLIASAAISSAKMDTVDDHWSISKYAGDSAKYPEKWFNSNISWNTYTTGYIIYRALADRFLPFYIRWVAKKKPGWGPIKDFWHWEKAKMIVKVASHGAITFLFGLRVPYCFIMHFSTAIMFAIGWIIVVGIVWNLTFNYYYDRKLVRKGFKKRWLWLKADTSV